MADNVTLPGTGSVVATDDVGGFQHQRVKIVWGPDGTVNDADIATNKSLPVQIRAPATGTAASFGLGTAGSGSQRVAICSDQMNVLGQAVMASSAPVVIASDQAAVNVSLGVGQKVMASSAPVTIASDQSALSVTLSVVGQKTMASSAPVTIASNQTAVPTKSGGSEYETVAASQTDQVLGASGAVGDYIEACICVVATAATSQVQIKDGNGSAITILPNAVGAGIGTYYVPLGLTAVNATSAGWKVTTAAGVSVIGTGDFT